MLIYIILFSLYLPVYFCGRVPFENLNKMDYFYTIGSDDRDHETKIQGTQTTSNLKHLQSHVP
jgi:hypothetical protein